MKNFLLLLSLFSFIPLLGFPQQTYPDQMLFIFIKDNTALQYVSNEYTFTSDSLKIRGDSDYGRKKIDYLARKLTRQEFKKITAFLKSFPLDSLEDAYFSDFTNMPYLSPDNYPRIVEVEGIFKGKLFKTKMTNCYAEKIAGLCTFLNEFIPSEVQIRLNKEKFNAFYR